MSIELRFQPNNLEVLEDGELVVSGYVNKTNQPSEILGSRQRFIEKIKPGTFKAALENREKDIDFLAEHDSKRILASTRNNSLSLTEDKEGLYMEAVIAPTSWGKDTYTLIKSGILKNMSFGFKVLKDSWRRLETNLLERTIEQIQLFEVSVVKDPAYSQSTIEARGIEVLDDVEIPLELDDEKQMEKVIEMLSEVLTKVNGVVSDVEAIKKAQAKVELREKESEELDSKVETEEKESVEEKETDEKRSVEDKEEQIKDEVSEKEEETPEEETEKEPEIEEKDEETEPEAEDLDEKRSLSDTEIQEFDSILSKLNQLKQEEN